MRFLILGTTTKKVYFDWILSITLCAVIVLGIVAENGHHGLLENYEIQITVRCSTHSIGILFQIQYFTARYSQILQNYP